MTNLIEALRLQVPAMQDRAAALDEAATFVTGDVAAMQQLGLPLLPLPHALGGLAAGTEAGGAETLFAVLRLLGRGNLSTGRIFEAHVNAVRLVVRYGTQAQLARVARAAAAGEVFGLWVTDAPNQVVRRVDGAIEGRKGPCSGAGVLRHALVTVAVGSEVRMALITLRGDEAVEPLSNRLHGMRASANGIVTLDGTAVPDDVLVGQDGDYLREPDLSTGAWRTMAVTLGGLDALTAAVRQQLRRRGHDTAPLQQARFGEMLIAQETARLWTWQAAQIAEAGTAPVADQVAAVNLARIAVEMACLDAMRHAQRALGLGALLRPNPVERLFRDLTTYLRQPAPDMVLTEAAAHALAQEDDPA